MLFQLFPEVVFGCSRTRAMPAPYPGSDFWVNDLILTYWYRNVHHNFPGEFALRFLILSPLASACAESLVQWSIQVLDQFLLYLGYSKDKITPCRIGMLVHVPCWCCFCYRNAYTEWDGLQATSSGHSGVRPWLHGRSAEPHIQYIHTGRIKLDCLTLYSHQLSRLPD